MAEFDAATAEALLRPRLRPGAIRARLDEAAGAAGWSVRFALGEGAVACTLEVEGVARSAVVAVIRGAGGGAEEAADRALARAAEDFGLLAPSAGAERRVPYDEATGEVLLDDDAGGALGPDEVAQAAVGVADEPAPLGEAPDLTREAAEARGVPAEGQRMIDRLVERLKDEGQGLAAARLLVRYGGYGKDPTAARELYRELRALLVRTGEPTQAQG